MSTVGPLQRGTTLRSRFVLGSLGLAAALLAGPALSYLPPAERVVRAVAQQNRADGRARPLQFELVLRPDVAGGNVGERAPIGRGVLVTHPTGLARLELRGSGGLVERHVLQGSEHLATRGGAPLDSPRAFLPPLYLLQTDSELGLNTGLAALGAETGSIGLAPCGESDCYVLGDPGRVPPPREGEIRLEQSGTDAPATGTLLDLRARLLPSLSAGSFTSIWIDLASFEIKRIDTRAGVRVWLGPPSSFDRVRAPSWFRIDEPGKQPVRFDVIDVAPVDAPAAAFSRTWLEGPVPPGGDMGGDRPNSPLGSPPQPGSGENY